MYSPPKKFRIPYGRPQLPQIFGFSVPPQSVRVYVCIVPLTGSLPRLLLLLLSRSLVEGSTISPVNGPPAHVALVVIDVVSRSTTTLADQRLRLHRAGLAFLPRVLAVKRAAWERRGSLGALGAAGPAGHTRRAAAALVEGTDEERPSDEDMLEVFIYLGQILDF
jgi:hypothetical protein